MIFFFLKRFLAGYVTQEIPTRYPTTEYEEDVPVPQD